MKESAKQLRQSVWYERVYKVGVAIKGFDGLVELIAGVWLLLAPGSLHMMLLQIMGVMNEHHGRVSDFIATYIAHVDQDLMRGGLWIVVAFLVSHGVVKLALVYALLKEILWAYPYALVVLVLFLVAQLYAFATHPSVGMAMFCLLDVLIIYLVWGEWQKLKSEMHVHRET